MLNYINIILYIIAIICIILGIKLPDKYNSIKWTFYIIGVIIGLFVLIFNNEEC